MAINDSHPRYTEAVEDWNTCRHTYRGERIIKEKGTLYLPATSGMEADGMGHNQDGRKAYEAYKKRAVFHDFVSDAVEAAIGVMHRKPASIDLPAVLEPLRERATVRGESLEQLLRRINVEQLVTGRLGLLLDLPRAPTTSQVLPHIAMYSAESIINWDEGDLPENVLSSLNLVVLDESEYERQTDFSWEYVNRYRVLVLGEVLPNETPAQVATYRQALMERDSLSFTEANLIDPQVRGKKLNEIPFVFVNSKDLVVEPDDPPLLGLAKLALAIYRGEADYRQSLFLQGQDTLVITGAGSGDDDTIRVGSGAQIKLANPQADAKFIGVDSAGLPEQRSALDSDKKLAMHRAGQLINIDKGGKESGEALNIRISAQTATLNQVALAGAEGLQTILRQAATWVGANPEEVVVEPNLDFADEEFTGEDLMKFMTAKTMGAPLSRESIHKLLQRRNITEMTLEEELTAIEEEGPTGTGTESGGDPGPGEDFPTGEE